MRLIFFHKKAYQIGMRELMMIVFALLIGIAILAVIMKGGFFVI